MRRRFPGSERGLFWAKKSGYNPTRFLTALHFVLGDESFISPLWGLVLFTTSRDSDTQPPSAFFCGGVGELLPLSVMCERGDTNLGGGDDPPEGVLSYYVILCIISPAEAPRPLVHLDS